MKTFQVKTAGDLYALKEICLQYDEVNIDLTTLRFEGLVRHAVKYANYALKVGGTMRIETAPFESYSLRRNKIDFWQVKYEVFNALKDTINIVEVLPKEGKLTLTKTKHLYNYTGISFGIVFSGNKQEEEQLVKAIESIIVNNNLQNFKYEILICGPTNYDPTSLAKEFASHHLRYVPLDISTTPRIMICEKKNLLYEQSKYSLVVISHCRILYTNNFVESLFNSIVEMATPAVYYKHEDQDLKYLDIGFFDSYQDFQLGAKRGSIAGENIQDDYMHWYNNRVPFIDGGLNVFNKNVIPAPPYNNYISWGEAEDVDVCNRLFQNGILIDYLPTIKCYSATCKLTGYNNTIKKAGRKLYNLLHQKRIVN